jgi:Trk K+ transport system NAD-binding subunit/Kef-type K+ transport system membrane component KefB
MRIGLPLISGFLLTGVLAGPYLLGVVNEGTEEHLRFVEQLALSFIAFAAGGELRLRGVHSYLRNIIAIIAGLTFSVFVLGTVAFIILSGWIPFMQGMSHFEVLGVALLGATIMVARSPSSAYAVIKELRARGPFTQTVLGVTVLMDAIVIVIFAANVSVAAVLLEDASFDMGLLFFLVFEIGLDIGIGILVGEVLRAILSIRFGTLYKRVMVLLTGYSVFFLSTALRDVHLGPLPVGIFSEPLLIGLVAGFVVTNYTRYDTEFHKIIEDTAPVVFILFFTLVGVSLELDVLSTTWVVALALLLVRLLGIVVGSFLGGAVTGAPLRQNVILSMTFITQAGVSVGLAKEIGVEFPAWGNELATLAIAVIVVNQIIGPPFFKWALCLVGEARPRGEALEFERGRHAVIFGVDDQSLALARQLTAHGWQVKLADTHPERLERLTGSDVGVHLLPEISPTTLRALEIEKAEALIAMLDDATNYAICEQAYELFGTKKLVVRLHDRDNFEGFTEFGALIVEPSTAIVGLLDHFVRSPSATSLLLGREENQDVVEVVVGNRLLHGVALRDLRFPADTLILSIRRQGHLLVSHGYTRLKLGDEVTVVGTPASLAEVQWRFEA